MRETEDAAESRLRENQKKTKAEADEDLREKTKVCECVSLFFSFVISFLRCRCTALSCYVMFQLLLLTTLSDLLNMMSSTFRTVLYRDVMRC